MLTILFDNHKLEIDTLPMQIIFYDGKEVSKKAAITGASTHTFSVIEGTEEAKYEINLSSIIGGSTLGGYGRGYEIRRNGKQIFVSKASKFSFVRDGHKIELKEKTFPMLKKIFYYDEKEVASKNIYLLVGTHNVSFSVTENNKQVDYEASLSFFSAMSMTYKIRRNGELILINDSSMSPTNASTTANTGSKVVGNIAGGIAGGLATGGHGTAAGITEGLSNSALKNTSNLANNLGTIKDVVDVLKKLDDKK